MTGDQIFSEALLLLGVIYPGQTLSPEAKTTCMLGINSLLSEWNATGQAVYSVQRVTYTLILNQADYTIGVGGNFNGPRPEKIEAWSSTPAGGGASDEGVPVSALEYERLYDDSAAVGSRIRVLNYDAAFPTGNIHIYPKPTGGQQLALWVWVQFAAVADSTLDIAFPPGFQKAVTYALAVDLAPKFGRPLDPNIKTISDECKAALGATNASVHAGIAPQAPAAAA